MGYEKYFEEIRKFKQELDLQEEFSTREKEIILEVWMLKDPSKNPTTIPQPTATTEIVQEETVKENFPDSFASLINRAKTNQHSDYIILAVYHLAIQKSYENVSVKDINDEYKKAYIKPTNTNVYLANHSRKGLLMPTEKKEGKAAFTITRDGITYVEALLNQNGE